MRYLPVVCLCALTFAAILFSPASAQSPALQQGISVQLAPTSNAAAFPAADRQDAWIIVVTADGRLFFGIKPVTAGQLAEEMKITPRRRDANLYIKADARVLFEWVGKALQAALTDDFDSAVLLTDQDEPLAPGKMVPPEGLEVALGSAPAEATVVQMHSSQGTQPTLKVNGAKVPMGSLKSSLEQALRGRTAKIVSLQVEDSLPFAQVANVVDTCHSLGAKIVLATR